jgi:protocatechuate 3,4-dioxygenase beta subunit
VKGVAQVVVSIPASISVSVPSRDMRPAETLVLSVVVVDDAGKPVTVPRTITWASSDPGVARVADGKVEAVGPGSATVTASTGSLKATSQITVRVPEFSKLALTPSKTQTLKKGDKLTLKVAALDKKGQKVAGVPVAWKSSDARIATVSPEGVVSAVKKGNAKITASSAGKSATVGITVTETASKSKTKSSSTAKKKK